MTCGFRARPLWTGRCPWVASGEGGEAFPVVGANTTTQIDDAVASLTIELTAEEIAALERPYTPRYDFQGISDEAAMQKIRDQIPGYANV